MPLYFFNIRNDDFTEDFEGHELADSQAAHAYAVKAARTLAAETVSRGHFTASDCIEILEENRRPVMKVTFGEAVELR